MASETQTTSFQRPYPGLARIRLSFPFVISGEGPASLKPRVGQGGSLPGGSGQKLNVAAWPLPVTRQGLEFAAPQFAPGVPLEKLSCKEPKETCVPSHLPASSPHHGPRISAARPEATGLSGCRAELQKLQLSRGEAIPL